MTINSWMQDIPFQIHGNGFDGILLLKFDSSSNTFLDNLSTIYGDPLVQIDSHDGWIRFTRITPWLTQVWSGAVLRIPQNQYLGTTLGSGWLAGTFTQNPDQEHGTYWWCSDYFRY